MFEPITSSFKILVEITKFPKITNMSGYILCAVSVNFRERESWNKLSDKGFLGEKLLFMFLWIFIMFRIRVVFGDPRT